MRIRSTLRMHSCLKRREGKRVKKYRLLATTFALAVLLAGCVVNESTPTNKEAIEIVKVEDKAPEKEKETTVDGFDASKLSAITYKVRSNEVSKKEAEKALNNVAAFLKEVPENLSEKQLLALYADGEVLKKFGGDNDAANIHEIGNWSNTYIKGVLTEEMRLERAKLLNHRDSLIESAQTRWNELQRTS